MESLGGSRSICSTTWWKDNWIDLHELSDSHITNVVAEVFLPDVHAKFNLSEGIQYYTLGHKMYLRPNQFRKYTRIMIYYDDK